MLVCSLGLGYLEIFEGLVSAAIREWSKGVRLENRSDGQKNYGNPTTV